MNGERRVAGLLCSEVLEKLGDFIDGTLGPSERAAVEAHLAGCSVCEQFGGSVAASVGALRRQRLARAEDGASVDKVIARLQSALLTKITT